MSKLYTITPQEGDVIINQFDTLMSVNEVLASHSNLVKAFPNNRVVSVPEMSGVYCIDRQSAIEFLTEMAESLK